MTFIVARKVHGRLKLKIETILRFDFCIRMHSLLCTFTADFVFLKILAQDIPLAPDSSLLKITSSLLRVLDHVRFFFESCKRWILCIRHVWRGYLSPTISYLLQSQKKETISRNYFLAKTGTVRSMIYTVAITKVLRQ